MGPSGVGKGLTYSTNKRILTVLVKDLFIPQTTIAKTLPKHCQNIANTLPTHRPQKKTKQIGSCLKTIANSQHQTSYMAV